MAMGGMELQKLCIVIIQIQGKSFKALIDGGSQVSLVTEGVLEKTRQQKYWKKMKIPAASWANEQLAFSGMVKLSFRLAETQHQVQFFSCEQLATKTDIILGLDWLKQANVTLSYSPDVVKLFLGQTQIPLTPSGQQIEFKKRQFSVYSVGNLSDIDWAKLKQPNTYIEAGHCVSIKVALNATNVWSNTAHFENALTENLEIPSQISRVQYENNEKKEPFAFILVYNPLDIGHIIKSGQRLCMVKNLSEAPIVSFINTRADYEKQSKFSLQSLDQGPDEDITIPPSNSEISIDSGVVADTGKQYTIEERRELVKQMLDDDYPDIHPVARKLLLEFPQVIHVPGVPFTGVKTLTHKIDYQGPLFYQKQYKIHVLETDVLKELERLLRAGIIEASDSPYSNAVLPILKPNGSIRLALDVRAMNRFTPLDRLYLGDLQEVLNELDGSTVFSGLDLQSGFHQLELTPESRKFTAFRWGNRAFQYRYLIFGVKNGPSSFSRLMALTLSGLKNVAYYIDDILIFTKDADQHAQVLRRVFERLVLHGLELSPAKCHYFKSEVKFLGFQVTPTGLKPLESYVEPLLKAKIPTTLTELRSLLGTFNFYRRFIKNFSILAKPLIDLTKGYDVKVKGSKAKIECTPAAIKAIQDVKHVMATRVTLKYPDFSQMFLLFCDASRTGIGSWLAQFEKDAIRPIVFMSRTLNAHEKNYSVIELEALSIVEALHKCRSFLLGSRVKIMTDARSLIYLFKFSDPNSRIYRWQLTVMEFQIENIAFLAGESNTVADWLSRTALPSDPVYFTPIMAAIASSGKPIRDRVGVITHSGIQSKIYQSRPVGFSINTVTGLGKVSANEVVVWPLDVINTEKPELSGGLGLLEPALSEIYTARTPIIDEQNFVKCDPKCDRCKLHLARLITGAEDNNRLGKVLWIESGGLTIMAIFAVYFTRPVVTSVREKAIHTLLHQKEWPIGELKQRLKHDSSRMNEFHYYQGLERELDKLISLNPTKVHIVWPKELNQGDNVALIEMFHKVAYCLYQADIECVIVLTETPQVNAVTRAQKQQSKAIPEEKELKALIFRDHMYIPPEKIRKEQSLEADMKNVWVYLSQNTNKTYEGYCLVNGIINKISMDKFRGEKYQIWLPKIFRLQIITHIHNASHEGFLKTLFQVRQNYYWDNMAVDIQKFTHICEVCQIAKINYRSDIVPGHMKVVKQQRYQLYIDVLGSLPRIEKNKKILVACDAVSKYIYAQALPDESAMEIIAALEKIFITSDFPRRVVSDNAGVFKSTVLGEFWKKKALRLYLLVRLILGQIQTVRTL